MTDRSAALLALPVLNSWRSEVEVFTFSEARQRLAALLDQAAREGEVRIRRRDGREFAIRPVTREDSPLDVPGVDLGLTREEIVAIVREGRERVPPWLEAMMERREGEEGT